MTVTLATLALALIPAALAQSIIDIQVGPSGNLVYDPPQVTAAVGDTIRFTFNPKNHTVTQSSFNEPCVPLVGGASSGFQFVGNNSGILPTWTFEVADASQPLWFHCEQTGHCGKGMVFAINAPAAPDPHSFEAFQALAEKLNGTTTSDANSTTSDASFTTPPTQTWATATATVTDGASVWTTVYTSYDGTPAPTYAPSPVDHKILVGADGLKFTPSNISAALGDTVTFEFHPKNHSVTQSSFLQPCAQLADTSTTGQVGFNSGFHFVAANATDFPTFTITINDTAPIWGYCANPGPPTHCSQEMVFSINAVEDGPNNFAAFQAIANHTTQDGVVISSSSGSSGSGSGSGSAAAASPSQSSSALVGTPVSSVSVVMGVLGVIGGAAALL